MSHPLVSLFACLVMLGLLTGCEPFPRDPSHSLQRIHERGSLRVGAMYGPPWVLGEAPGTVQGVEGRLVAAFAERLGVQLEAEWGSEQDLFDSLRHHELDVIIGGLTADSPWRQEAGFTAPYYVSRVAVAVPQGEPTPQDAAGLTVSITRQSHLYDELRRRGASVEQVNDLTAATGPVAARQWEIRGLGYQETEIMLQQRRHVMAVARGENALIMELERFFDAFVADHDMDRLVWETSRQ